MHARRTHHGLLKYSRLLQVALAERARVATLLKQTKNYPSFLRAGTKGGGKGGQTTLATWLGKFPVLPGGSVETECDGDLLAQPDWAGKTYCDEEQAGKVFAA